MQKKLHTLFARVWIRTQDLIMIVVETLMIRKTNMLVLKTNVYFIVYCRLLQLLFVCCVCYLARTVREHN